MPSRLGRRAHDVKDNAVSFRRFPLWRNEILINREDVFGNALKTDAGCQSRQHAAKLGVNHDVDLLTTTELRLHLLGKHSGSGKPPDQLLATLGAGIDPALVDQDEIGDIAKPPLMRSRPSVSGSVLLPFETRERPCVFRSTTRPLPADCLMVSWCVSIGVSIDTRVLVVVGFPSPREAKSTGNPRFCYPQCYPYRG